MFRLTLFDEIEKHLYQGVSMEIISEAPEEGKSCTFSELSDFMSGPDRLILRKLIDFFSKLTGDLQPRYLFPDELMQFWTSLSQTEKDYYWNLLYTEQI